MLMGDSTSTNSNNNNNNNEQTLPYTHAKLSVHHTKKKKKTK